MKKATLILMSGLAIATVGVGTASVATAASTHTSSSVVKHGRDDRQVRIDARLNQAVRDGTITAAQKTAFTAEVKTLRTTEKASLKAATTKAERQTARQTFRTKLEPWANTTNFPLSKILPKL